MQKREERDAPAECLQVRRTVPSLACAKSKGNCECDRTSPPLLRCGSTRRFCCTLIMRRSRSAWLLSKGTAKSSRKRSTAHLPPESRSNRLRAGLWLARPGVRFPCSDFSVGLGGDWPGSLRPGWSHSDEASLRASADPVHADPMLWLAPLRLSSPAVGLSSSWPRAAGVLLR